LFEFQNFIHAVKQRKERSARAVFQVGRLVYFGGTRCCCTSVGGLKPMSLPFDIVAVV